LIRFDRCVPDHSDANKNNNERKKTFVKPLTPMKRARFLNKKKQQQIYILKIFFFIFLNKEKYTINNNNIIY
jgi:hypothetical protein